MLINACLLKKKNEGSYLTLLMKDKTLVEGAGAIGLAAILEGKYLKHLGILD